MIDLFSRKHLHVKMVHTLIEKIFSWLFRLWILYSLKSIQLVAIVQLC